ncbi:hypothetical protein HRR83_005898 [Exophiala dermatitidis]|uniref:Uncharacterized protein n=1 Tax=Exophiala dermatitidis TaxID=5970 RepID=A0AAN6EM41_EXODE|nr:hypothetical protein HRR75_007458 [Exophiala dermatitidis]KAJ4507204.1 hypothetical protein HRR74_008127 [Exophiala dermatitidis]KAJ4517321.1 hypothetical protein HRR73_004373 [Exophiala dermatitidis]KAJ4548933.1 hypothetical protein HRR76_001508 [Exophiala dermatitidis]KAJ4550705.1 hypothetical protein HRR78_004474 [Exophiala dermatitidis]
MPREIADSDDESDLNSPIKQLEDAQVVVGDAGPSQASLSGYDFDQFLAPTQRLSSLSPIQDRPDMRLRSSISHLDGTSEGAHATTTRQRKRPHSALEETSHELVQGGGNVKDPASKKTKVYGHPSRARTVHDIDLFAAAGESSTGLQDTDSLAADEHVSAQPTSDQAQGTIVTNGSASTNLTIPSGIISLLNQSTTDESHRLTTSVASMGQYQCLNLDFRGSGQGLDVNSNPFGALSQVSLDEDPNPAETERFASMFRPIEDEQNVELLERNPADSEGTLPNHILSEVLQIAPDQALTVDLARIVQNDGAASDIAPAENHPTPAAAMADSDMPARSKAVMAEQEKPPPKKRGRKPKNAKVASLSPAPGVADDVDELALTNHLPPPCRARRGTVESVDEDQQSFPPPETSPAKLPTSEVEEALIGLPREQYKPRPSRSRSKRVIDEDEALMPPPVSVPAQATPARANAVDVTAAKEQTPTTTSAKASGKKPGRKSKVKRAKTSAAALLKKTDPMLSEGEDDVVWMDSKPAPVKLDLPPDLKVLKKEADAPKEDQEEQEKPDCAEQSTTREEREAKIVVAIPAPVEAKDHAAEPKKRGRKPKKAAQQKEAAAQPDEDEAQDISSTTRPPLAEKSSNIPVTEANKDDERRAPTMSPITDYDPQPALQSPRKGEEKEVPLETLAAVVTPSKKDTEKGPTKHSPINALNLSSGRKVTYRVGLSRRQNIPSLLRKVQRDKPPPTIVVRKEPKPKKGVEVDYDGDGDGEGRSGLATGELRGEDGMLIEWGD